MITEVTFFTSAQRFRHFRHLKIRTELSSAFCECSQSGKRNGKCEAHSDHLHLGNWPHFTGKLYIFLYTYHLLICYGQTSTLKLYPHVNISKHLWQNWKRPSVKELPNVLLPSCIKTQGFHFKKGKWWRKKRKM